MHTTASNFLLIQIQNHMRVMANVLCGDCTKSKHSRHIYYVYWFACIWLYIICVEGDEATSSFSRSMCSLIDTLAKYLCHVMWSSQGYLQERLKRRNALCCLEQYAAQIANMLDPQSHHNPQPKRSFTSGTLNMIPPWNFHTVKQSMPRSCSNGCSLNWFTLSQFFQFFQLSN